MFNFQENECQVVNEEECVNHAVGVPDDLEIVQPPFLFVEYSDTVEKPKREDEDKEKDRQSCNAKFQLRVVHL